MSERGSFYHGKYGKRLGPGQVIQGDTDFLVDQDGLHSCIGLAGHRLTDHEAGVNIVRICEEPIPSQCHAFIPRSDEVCASCP